MIIMSTLSGIFICDGCLDKKEFAEKNIEKIMRLREWLKKKIKK